MRSTNLLPGLLLALLPLASCQSVFDSGVPGDGHVTSEMRSGLGDFDSIDMSGGMRLNVVVGEPTSLEIETDSNLHEYVETRVQGGVLMIEQRQNLSPTDSITATIHMPSLNSIEVSGSARLAVSGVDSQDFELDCSGSLSGTIEGRATECEVDAAGSMKLDLTGLVVQQMEIDVAGSCSMKVHVEDTLNVSVAGSASIGYLGQPAVDVSQSGSARVYTLEE